MQRALTLSWRAQRERYVRTAKKVSEKKALTFWRVQRDKSGK